MSHLEAIKLEPRDRAAIEALITDFFALLDCGPAERLGELFVPDGAVKALDIGLDIKGNRAISEFFAAHAHGRGFVARHSWNSLRILEVGEQEIRSSCIVVTYLGARPEVTSKDFSVGIFEDVFRRTPDRHWLFLSRNQVKIIS